MGYSVRAGAVDGNVTARDNVTIMPSSVLDKNSVWVVSYSYT